MSSTGIYNDKFDTTFVYLFKYIIIGDMGIDMLNIILYSCRKKLFTYAIYR